MVFGGYQNTTPPCPFASSCVSADSWTLDRGLWANVTPALPSSTDTPTARYGAALAYDSARSEFVLFGGASQLPNGFNNPALWDTWVFTPSNLTWTEACLNCTAGTDAPPPRWDPGVAYDAQSQQVVLFGGQTTNTGATAQLSDTWTFNGSAWSQVTGGTAPAARASPSMAWDAQTGSVILFGGVPTTAATGRTWSFSAGGWSALSPASSPPEMGGSSAVTDPVNGSVTLVGGCTSDPCTTGAINQTWSYSRGDWYRLFPYPHPAPAGRDHEALFDIGPEHAIGLFAGDAKGLPSNDTWYLYHLEVGGVDASPLTVDIGQAVSLRVNVTGGFGYDSFRWVNLPPGCSSSNASSIACTATGAGPYSPTIRVEVTDEIAQSVYAPGVLVRFDADPAVSVTASPMVGIVPLQTSFFATAAGGTGTITYQWNFGDRGIGVGPNPSHTYETAGNFTATVWANDTLGVASHSSVTVRAIPLLGLNLAVSPVSLQVGNTSVIVATGFGGLGPYSYTFEGLPTGCTMTTANETTCTIAMPGTYRFTVVVADHSSQSARANGSLYVAAKPPGVHSSSVPIGDWDLLGIGIAAGIAVGLAVILLFRRKSSRPPERPITTTVPVPDPHELPAMGGSLYVPPPENKAPKRKP